MTNRDASVSPFQWPHKSDASRHISRVQLDAFESDSDDRIPLQCAPSEAIDLNGREQAICSAGRAERDGCDCPGLFGLAVINLLRCVHLDDKRVALFRGKPGVIWVQANYDRIGVLYKGNCYGTALDAFYAAEEALLAQGGEA